MVEVGLGEDPNTWAARARVSESGEGVEATNLAMRLAVLCIRPAFQPPASSLAQASAAPPGHASCSAHCVAWAGPSRFARRGIRARIARAGRAAVGRPTKTACRSCSQDMMRGAGAWRPRPAQQSHTSRQAAGELWGESRCNSITRTYDNVHHFSDMQRVVPPAPAGPGRW